MATFVRRATYRVDTAAPSQPASPATGPAPATAAPTAPDPTATAPDPAAPYKLFEGEETQARERAEAYAREQRAAGHPATVTRTRLRYQARVRIMGHPQQSAYFDRLTDAKRWASGIESAIHEGRHFKSTEARRRTLAELIDRYVRDALPRKKAKTQAPQMGQLFYWKTHLGHKTLADCTPAAIAEQRDLLKSTPIASRAESEKARAAAVERYPGPATINRYLAALSHAFTFAVKELGWTEDNPLLKVSKEKEPSGRTRFLSDEERERFLAACRQSTSPDLYPAVVLALATGARQMEIMKLTWKRVDFTRKVALLEETKNGERRILPLTGHALDLLRERAKVRRLDTDLVFPARFPARPAKPGNPIATVRPIDLRTPFETALARAKIDDFTWHDLRHTAASYLAMNGASLTEIAAILGHKTLAMVKRYSHLSEAHTASVVERMNSRMFGSAA